MESGRAGRVALVGPTLHDVREVMIGGPSGLMNVGVKEERPAYSVSRRRLSWPNGAEAFAFSAEDPESLRGPQFDAGWCDEIGAWKRDVEVWRMLWLGMRVGRDPRVVATTTPKPFGLVRTLAEMAEAGRGGVVVTRAGSAENAGNLAPGWIAAMEAEIGGTALGRQELEGEIVDGRDGALWTRWMIEACRVVDVGVMERVVVGVDPPAGVGGAACGIVAAGLRGGVVFVLADASVRGLRPLQWAARVAAVARGIGAGVVAAEANQGGEMVRELLDQAGCEARVKLVHAKESKGDRAQPLSFAYETGRVKHVGVFRELEDEMCAFGASGGPSPDRVDALVWAWRELTAKPPPMPRIDVM